MSGVEVQSLIDFLWPQGDWVGGPQVHMLLDGARDPAISQLVRGGNLEYECLFAGHLSARLQTAAPYLVHLEAASPLTLTLLERSWNQDWGIFSIAPHYTTLAQQRIHFKKLLRVRDETGKEMAFRFYDPRVARVFLPMCTGEQIEQFFGPLQAIVAQSDHPGVFARYTPDSTRVNVSFNHSAPL
ncbi:MAG: DUF4123 domain-containing protein [Massilia sp.]